MDIEILTERYSLALERIREIPGEHFGNAEFEEYFASVAGFLLQIEETKTWLWEGGLTKAPLEELVQRNHALYEDIMPENYESSYANPAYAVEKLGEEFGAMLAFLYTEMRSLIGFVFEKRLEELVIRMELFTPQRPAKETIRQILYWFASDYADVAAQRRIYDMVVPEENFAADIIRNSDTDDVRYLFAYGEYVGENELEVARFMAAEHIDPVFPGKIIGNTTVAVKKMVCYKYTTVA